MSLGYSQIGLLSLILCDLMLIAWLGYPTRETNSRLMLGIPTVVCGAIRVVKNGLHRRQQGEEKSRKEDTKRVDEWITEHIGKHFGYLARFPWMGSLALAI